MNSQLEIKLAPTPETDAELNYRSYGFFCTMGGLPAEAVGADFARELERERDRYQESADALVDRLGATQERMINAERERNELREKVWELTTLLQENGIIGYND